MTKRIKCSGCGAENHFGNIKCNVCEVSLD